MPRPFVRAHCAIPFAALPFLAGACTHPDPFGPRSLGTPRDLAAATAVAAGDLDGDGDDSLVLIQDEVATWGDQRLELGGLAQVVARGDVDGDGLDEILLGCGMGRGSPRAPARVWLIDQEGSRLLWERDGARNQVSDLRVLPVGLWMATFADGRRVEGGWLRPVPDGGPWQLETVLDVSLGLEQMPLGDRVLVGRVYGDEPRSDGDLRAWKDGAWTPLPSLRGVRSLAHGDLGRHGEQDLLVGDGWHYRYGSQAVGRVRLLHGPDWKTGRTIASFDGEFSARELAVVGQGLDAWILVTASENAHVLARDGLGWQDLLVAAVGEQGMAVPARLDGQAGVLVSGDPARWVPVLR